MFCAIKIDQYFVYIYIYLIRVGPQRGGGRAVTRDERRAKPEKKIFFLALVEIAID